VISIGLALFLRHIYLVIFKGNPRSFEQYATQQQWSLGPLSILPKDVAIIVVSVVVLVALVVFGAGHDALPIIELARQLGWQTEVVDPQARPASRTRFAQAERVTLARPETISEQVTITPRTLTLVMSHNYAHDQALLKFLLASPARYIGVLGPRKRTERMLNPEPSRRWETSSGSRSWETS
jgi:xanthine/CO dehydrogenase XdhC/CoxF family maturation factor